MAEMAPPEPSPRTVPVKVTMAPMSVRPAVRRRTSAEMSKSSFCTRTLTALASGHRREEGDLARPGQARGGLDVGAVDGRADHVGAGEGLGVLGSTALEPGHQVGHGADPGRQVDDLLGLAGLLAHPGEVEDPYGHGLDLMLHGGANGGLEIV